VAYTDHGGKRRIKSFNRQRDANNYHASVSTDLRSGMHVPDSESIMVAEAAKLWLVSCETTGLEPSTLAAYRQRVALHIVPLIGAVKLSQLTAPRVRAFEDKLALDRSPVMVRQVVTTLGAVLADALDRGLVGQNVVRGRSRARRGTDKRKGKLKIGVDIPTPDEIRKLIAALDGHWRPLFMTAVFTGLRASELRGLRWSDVNLKRGEIHVRQRADCYSTIGRLKSEAGERIVPLLPIVVTTLREYRLACPKGTLDLVFPNGAGNIENYSNITKRGLIPLMIAAGITVADGKAKYTGLHSLRHFYASWCINRRVDGGLELPLKLVQARLGHASIQMTADRYGHLFPRGDDTAELAAAEKAFLSA
jgi:integrase